MKQNRYSEEQFIKMLKEVETGILARISHQAAYCYRKHICCQ